MNILSAKKLVKAIVTRYYSPVLGWLSWEVKREMNVDEEKNILMKQPATIVIILRGFLRKILD